MFESRAVRIICGPKTKQRETGKDCTVKIFITYTLHLRLSEWSN
jgi:hypothetical protein